MEYLMENYSMYDFAYPRTYGTSFYEDLEGEKENIKLLEEILRLSKTNDETIKQFITQYKNNTSKLNLLDRSKINEFTNNLIIQILINRS